MTVRQFSPRALKQARLRGSLTQHDLAHELRSRGFKTDGNQIRRWETGLNAPRASAIPVLADVLGVTIDSLYGTTSDDDEEAALLRDVAKLPEDLRRRIERALARRVPA